MTGVVREIPPYARLARHYDRLMDYIDYDEWVDVIHEVLKPYSPGKTWLDISCGTGSMAVRLARQNHRMTIVDLSPDMIEVAREKAVGLDIKLDVGDMRTWQVDQRFDVVLNLHDGLNYLLDMSDLQQFMSNAHDLLNPGGVLLCDVATPLLCQRHFKGYHEMFADEQHSYERTTEYAPHERLAETMIRIYQDDRIIEVERHLQRAYDLTMIQSMVADSPFNEAVYLDDDSLETADEHTERILLLLRRGP